MVRDNWKVFKKWWKGFAKSGVNVPDRIVDRFELAEVISEKIKEIDSDLERKRNDGCHKLEAHINYNQAIKEVREMLEKELS